MSTVPEVPPAEVLPRIERLIELARKKQAVLIQRNRRELPAIVAAEEAVLAELATWTAKKDTVPRDAGQAASAAAAQLQAAILELQRINSTNADLIKEELSTISTCLELIQQAATPTYSAHGDRKGEGKAIPPVLNVRA